MAGKSIILVFLAIFIQACAKIDKLISANPIYEYRDETIDKRLKALKENWEKEPIHITTNIQVFYDDALIHSISGDIKRVYARLKKLNDGLPVFTLEPFEAETREGIKAGTFYFSIYREKNIYRMWYQFGGNVGHLGHAYSYDGMRWIRTHGKHGRMSLKNPVHGPSVLIDEFDSRSSHRYKLVYGYGRGYGSAVDYGISFAHSHDGINWVDSNDPHPINDVRSDTHNGVLYDPEIGAYRVTTRMRDFENGRGYIQFARSYIDLPAYRFLPYALGITPLAKPWTRIGEYRLPDRSRQIYSFIMWKEGDIYIGSVNILENNQNKPYIVFSRDGINWDWTTVLTTNYFIENGDIGSFDRHGQFLAGSRPIETDGRLVFYYAGFSAHRYSTIYNYEPTVPSAIGCGTIKPMSYAWLESGENESIVETKLLKLPNRIKHITVYYESASCDPQISILVNGLQVQKKDAENCTNIMGDVGTGADDIKCLIYKLEVPVDEIRIKFYVGNLHKLYGFKLDN